MLPDGTSFKVIITPPTLEYTVECHNIVFVKFLSFDEIEQLTKNLYVEWQQTALQMLQQNKKFSDLLLDIDVLALNQANQTKNDENKV